MGTASHCSSYTYSS